MGKERDVNRTRNKLVAAALKEFAAKGLAGARTRSIARSAGVNERMIFYCFGSKEGLYRAVLREELAARTSLIELNPEDDFTASLVKGFRENCVHNDLVRIWQWEALDSRKGKLVAENERRSLARAQVSRLRRTKARGALPPEADEEMLLLASAALRIFPLALPQAARLIAGMEPLDPRFRRRWTACLEWIGGRLQARVTAGPSGRTVGRGKAEVSAAESKAQVSGFPKEALPS